MKAEGTSTLLAAVLMALLVLVGTGLVAAARLVAAHVQATTAADAAALAAAPLTFLPGDPAAEAAGFAAANGARLVACRCPPDPGLGTRVVMVEVAADVELPVFGAMTVRARAAAEFAPLDLLGG